MCLRHRDLDWAKFVSDEVDDRDEYLIALETCDACLQEYTQQLETVLEAPSPDFTALAMAKIAAEKARGAKKKAISRLKPFWHYIVAACLTLFLFELGAFDWLSQDFQSTMSELNLAGQLLKQLGELLSSFQINLGG